MRGALDLNGRQGVLNDFSACMLCGRFLATVLAKLGDRSLDDALRQRDGVWLKFPWHPSFGQALIEFFDWHYDGGEEHHGGHCPLCYRRMIYQQEGEQAVLLLESTAGRPG